MHLARRRGGAALGDADFWALACAPAAPLPSAMLRARCTVAPREVTCGRCRRTGAYAEAERIAAETAAGAKRAWREALACGAAD